MPVTYISNPVNFNKGTKISTVSGDYGLFLAQLFFKLSNVEKIYDVAVCPYQVNISTNIYDVDPPVELNNKLDKIVRETILKISKVIKDKTVFIESSPKNDRWRMYNTVGLKLHRSLYTDFERPILSGDEENLAEIDKTVSDIIRRLFVIQGVTKVLVRPYEFQVEIGAAFEWDRIDPEIHSVFGDVLDSTDLVFVNSN